MSFPAAGGNLEEVFSQKNQEKIKLALAVANGMQHLAKYRVINTLKINKPIVLGNR
jgi:hypothetical protein